jgi:hypothetical protein
LTAVSIDAPYQSIVRITEPCRILSDSVHHRLKVSRCAGDQSQNFTRCGLLFRTLSKFFRLRSDLFLESRERR